LAIRFGCQSIRFGFFCSTADNKVTTNRKIQLKNLTFERVFETFRRNLEDLVKLLEISKKLGCGIFRLGSNFIPFASHRAFKKEWLSPIEEILRQTAPKIREFQIRITMHPGQYVVLNSPKREVVEASLRELEYHFWVLECLGIGREGVVVIHGGGVYGDKRKSLELLRKTLRNHSWLIERLAIENDEKNYTVSDLMTLVDLGVPIVFDHYHHRLNPSNFCVKELISSWKGRIPEVHLSSSPKRNHRFGEHGELIEPEDFLDLLNLVGENRVDIIFEAKLKELAIIKLKEDLPEIFGSKEDKMNLKN